ERRQQLAIHEFSVALERWYGSAWIEALVAGAAAKRISESAARQIKKGAAELGGELLALVLIAAIEVEGAASEDVEEQVRSRPDRRKRRIGVPGEPVRNAPTEARVSKIRRVVRRELAVRAKERRVFDDGGAV